MSIIRGPRPEANWYTLDKRISEDARLSWAARGLLIFLLGKPDHWEVSVKHLINQTSQAIGKASGRDAVRVILKELEQAGYLTADVARGEGGAFNGMAYTVCETPSPVASPETDFPAPAKPTPAKPEPVKPTPANPHQVNTDPQQSTDLERETDLQLTPPTAGAVGVGQVARAPLIIEAHGRTYEFPAGYPGPGTKSHKTWLNYASCYQKRHGTWPLWNATVAGQITKFIDRVGIEVAPKVAAYYLTVNDAFVVNAMHSVSLLLKDAEKYHTQYTTGRGMTMERARQIDKTQSNYDALSEAKALLEQRRNEHAAQ